MDVSGWPVVEPENAGAEEKVWVEDPAGLRWLFKPRTERPSWSQGEDWAERVSTELARRLGVPVARTEFAVRDGRRGTISADVAASGWELQPGALLLAEALPDYEPMTRRRAGHDLDGIERVLALVAAPDGHEGSSAFQVFAGYLVLDALIANQDRHEENWGVLRPLPGLGTMTLAPSYDHGSALGFNLQDEKRLLELARGGVAAWAGRARAQRFDQLTDGRSTLVQLAHDACRRAGEVAGARWLSSLDDLDEESFEDLLLRVPGLSDPARRFTLQLLAINRRRLLDGAGRDLAGR